VGGGTVGQGRGADRGRGEGGSTCLFRGSPPSQVPVCCRCHMASSVVWSLLHLQVLFDAGAATNNTIVDAWSRHTCGEVIALGRNCIGESGVVPTPTPPSYPHFPSTPPLPLLTHASPGRTPISVPSRLSHLSLSSLSLFSLCVYRSLSFALSVPLSSLCISRSLSFALSVCVSLFCLACSRWDLGTMQPSRPVSFPRTPCPRGLFHRECGKPLLHDRARWVIPCRLGQLLVRVNHAYAPLPLTCLSCPGSSCHCRVFPCVRVRACACARSPVGTTSPPVSPLPIWTC
jgi:hypothetical protein